MPKKITPNHRLSDYDYELPKKLIAQQALKKRENAKLLVLNKMTEEIKHRHFFDLSKILKKGDVLVFNDSKVIPARLIGKKETGGQVEIFLLNSTYNKKGNFWHCLIGGKIKEDQIIYLNKKVTAKAIKKTTEREWLVEFNVDNKKLFSLGHVPLPPYIKKESKMSDYQTVYAKNLGSVASPTAGLHFTKKLLNSLTKKGIQIEFVTLHVGLGTFLPVETENILEHKMHSEWAQVSKKTAKKISLAKTEGRRLIAVGTTTVRVLESFGDKGGKIKSGSDWLDIFIYPGHSFKVVDALITNFHLPKSTLLMLVSAFIEDKSKLSGRKILLKTYHQAIVKKYRFFSFGDGMLIE